MRRAYEQGQISEAQLHERSNSLLGGVTTESLEATSGPVINLVAPATTEGRAFGPSSGDTSNTFDLEVTVRNMPSGGRGRFVRQDATRTQISHRVGTTTTVTGVLPGLSAIDYIVEDASGKTRASIRIPISVPQFVEIRQDAAALDVALAALVVADVKDEVLRIARATAAYLLRTANVRLVWAMPPFVESLPASFAGGQPAAGNATTVTLRGNPPVPGLLGSTPTAPGVGPGYPNEAIDIYPGALDDNTGIDVGETVRLTVQALQTANMTDPRLKNLAIQVIGRSIGFAVAHEVLHAILGFEIPTGHNTPPIPHDIMNHGIDLGITDLSGIVVTNNIEFPAAEESFEDLGIAGMVRAQPSTRAVIDRFFPVPPVF
ncbi:hypothetical protein ACQP1G_19755 [Nocardia sp. CA-107356]|uniref:hypothetical protein n=1 Tax=Nocardia sp. CA-107356 TaxID=3239972 RepID=UPI003D8DE54A